MNKHFIRIHRPYKMRFLKKLQQELQAMQYVVSPFFSYCYTEQIYRVYPVLIFKYRTSFLIFP